MAFTDNNKVTAGRVQDRIGNLVRGLLLVALCLPLVSVAAVKMQNIEFSSLPGDKIEIRMEFDGTPPNPTGYTIEQPARIALD
ncbi:MAG: hypothetical protein WD994_06575, partial [Pseudomonadales bacterium]